jgi:rRNA-processing protein FCF1
MTKATSRILVIDASVVRSAGETEHPVSSACRQCLLDVLRICHHVVVTEPILDEWNKHMSRFSRKWRRSMAAKKKPLRSITPAAIAIDTSGLSPREVAAVEKDRCLIEAAVAEDHVIVTLDDALMSILAKTVNQNKYLKEITWINPVTDGTTALEAL